MGTSWQLQWIPEARYTQVDVVWVKTGLGFPWLSTAAVPSQAFQILNHRLMG